MSIDIRIFSVGPFQENTILLKKDNQAILIDPGFYTETEYQTFKQELGSHTLNAVYLTHSHIDHVLGLSRVLTDFDIAVFLSHEDLYLWENAHSQSQMFGLKMAKLNFTPKELKEGNVDTSPFQFKAIYTPGHAPDHLVFYFEEEGFVIAGDALFRDSIGRTDLYKGDFNLLAKSIREKLYTLPDATVVYPGHGPSTSIGHEKMNNPFVKP